MGPGNEASVMLNVPPLAAGGDPVAGQAEAQE